MSKKDLVAIIQGGTGNQGMRLALIDEVKENFNDVYVIAPYADFYQLYEDEGVTAFQQAPNSLYEQLIRGSSAEDVEIVAINPYEIGDFVAKRIHFFDAVRTTLGLPRKGTEECMSRFAKFDEKLNEKYPDICKEAEDEAKKLLKDHKKKYICLVQSSGGQSPLGNAQGTYSPLNDPLVRPYRHFAKMIELLQKKYPDTLFVQYRLKNEPEIKDTVTLEHPYLYYNQFAKYCEAVIAIDSSLQHIVTETSKHTNILWAETLPTSFGYSKNNNIFFVKNELDTEPFFSYWQNKPAVIKYKTPEEVIEELDMGECK